jgi:hypothetical protein
MFKSAFNAKGELLAHTTAMSNILQVSTELYNVLAGILGVGGTDHTYLKLGIAPSCEIVKVDSVSSTAFALVVQRGQENTTPNTFAAFTPIEFALGEMAVRDMIQEINAPNFILNASAPLHAVQNATNDYTISIDDLALVSDDDSILVSGTYPNISLAVNSQHDGCCT